MTFLRPSIVLPILIISFVVIWAILLPSNLTDPQVFVKDAGSYSQTAVHLAQENIYTLEGGPYLEREPGYAFFLSIIYRIFGVENRTAIFAVQALLYLACVLIFLREFYRRSHNAALITAAFLFLSPSIHRTIFSVLRENLTLCLFLLLIALIFSFIDKQTIWKALGIGVFLGMISLTYFSFVFIPLFLIAYLLWKKCSWKYLIIIFFLPYFFVSLWGLRNLSVSGEFRIIGSERAAASWYGRAEQARTLRGVQPFECLWAKYVSQDFSKLPKACSMDTMRHEYNDRAQEGDVPNSITVIKQNFFYYLEDSLIQAGEYQLPYIGFWGRTYNIFSAIEMCILGLGCLLALRRWKEIDLFLVIWIYGTAFFALNEVVQRFHMPIMIVYMGMAGIGYASLFKKDGFLAHNE